MSRDGTRSNDPCWCGSGRKFKRCHRDLAASVRPGEISPRRPVPAGIARPDYADDERGRPGGEDQESPVKTPEVIEAMRRAGQAAAQVLAVTGAAAGVGVTGDELDAICHSECIRLGGYPSPLNYKEFPKSVCTSVNEVICHGIPDSRPLADGDIVNLDVTVYLDGVHGDTNATFLVGEVDQASRRLVRVTRECLELGIGAVRPGRPISDIGRVIQRHAESHGFGVVRAFVGHGIGTVFHCEPTVPHYYEPSPSTIMVPNMAFTIEPMITQGSWQCRVWDDGWTAVTLDNSRSAQFEHTLVVTETGAEVLTRLSDREPAVGARPA